MPPTIHYWEIADAVLAKFLPAITWKNIQRRGSLRPPFARKQGTHLPDAVDLRCERHDGAITLRRKICSRGKVNVSTAFLTESQRTSLMSDAGSRTRLPTACIRQKLYDLRLSAGFVRNCAEEFLYGDSMSGFFQHLALGGGLRPFVALKFAFLQHPVAVFAQLDDGYEQPAIATKYNSARCQYRSSTHLFLHRIVRIGTLLCF